MILLPKPLPQEHFTSVLERAYLAYSGFTRKQFARLCGVNDFCLIRNSHWIGSCIQFSEMSGLELQEVLADHSLFPLVVLSMKDATCERLTKGDADYANSFGKALIGYPSIHKFRAFCPICVKEQYKEYGVTYWKRQWLLNSVRFCAQHKCELVAPVSWDWKDKSAQFKLLGKNVPALPQFVTKIAPLRSNMWLLTSIYFAQTIDYLLNNKNNFWLELPWLDKYDLLQKDFLTSKKWNFIPSRFPLNTIIEGNLEIRLWSLCRALEKYAPGLRFRNLIAYIYKRKKANKCAPLREIARDCIFVWMDKIYTS